jgi:PTH1 family peptidyl-tRNA hydrolase
MYLIVGLGNPGLRYISTRHNIGFIVIDKVAEFFKITSYTEESDYLYSVSHYRDHEVVLMKPLTYMNASGMALKSFFEKHPVPLENILVIYDDVNLDFGIIRMRPGGSDGGQNGIKSVIYEIQTQEIPRLRIGIRNTDELQDADDLADYVLSEFNDEEQSNLDKITETSKNAVLSFIDEGIKETMNKFNKNVLENNNNINHNNEEESNT